MASFTLQKSTFRITKKHLLKPKRYVSQSQTIRDVITSYPSRVRES